MCKHGAVAPRATAATVAAVLAAAAAAVPAGAAPKRDSAVPQDYIAGFAKRGVDCAPWRARTWVSWQTYAAGRVGQRWRGAASSRSLCGLARATGTRDAARRAVAGLQFTEVLAVSANGRARRLESGAPSGWRCYRLPTQWSLSAFALDRDGPGGLDEAFAAAAGLAAPFGFCVSRARLIGSKYAGGRFFTWGPDIADCTVRLNLMGTPDPASPGSEVFPSYSTVTGSAGVQNLVPFYDQTPC